jgi:KaiC/GvpD/RAD55 family RecA-like ATPase
MEAEKKALRLSEMVAQIDIVQPVVVARARAGTFKIDPPFQTGNFVELPYLEWISAAAPRGSTASFYFDDVESFLNDCTKNPFLHLVGPPGCGKTTAMWLFFLVASVHFDRPSVWINMKALLRVVVYKNKALVESITNPLTVLDEDVMWAVDAPLDSTSSDSSSSLAPATKKQKLAFNINSEDYSYRVVVFDGLDTKLDDYSLWRGVLKKVNKSLRSVTRTGYYFVSSIQSADIVFPDLVVKRYFHHWDLAKYKDVCQNDNFFKSVVANLGGSLLTVYTPEDRNQLIERKYAYAGVSARFMFDMTKADVITQIQRAMSSIKNFNDVRTLNLGASSTAAVNRILITDFTSEICMPMLVSDYVRKLLTRFKSTANDLVSATHYFRDHPVMNGWVFDCDFMEAVREDALSDGRTRSIHYSSAGVATLGESLSTTWRTKGFVRFEEDILGGNPGWDIDTDEMWMCPRVFYQGGYDLIQFVKIDGTPTLRFIQITVNMKHTLKAEYMRIFADDFNAKSYYNTRINNLEIVFAIPSDKFDQMHRSSTPENWDVSCLTNRPVTRLTKDLPALVYSVQKYLISYSRCDRR